LLLADGCQVTDGVSELAIRNLFPLVDRRERSVLRRLERLIRVREIPVAVAVDMQYIAILD
jgi:hypothetical protein